MTTVTRGQQSPQTSLRKGGGEGSYPDLDRPGDGSGECPTSASEPPLRATNQFAFDLSEEVFTRLAFAAFAVIGAVIVARQSQNVIGWLRRGSLPGGRSR
jgi:hypothetical protein